MSEIQTFFRFCPSCGRRFHIKLVGKKLVDSKHQTIVQKRAIKADVIGMRYGGMPGAYATSPVVLEQDVPVTINTEDFQYSYKCKHCGHEWTENRSESNKEG